MTNRVHAFQMSARNQREGISNGEGRMKKTTGAERALKGVHLIQSLRGVKWVGMRHFKDVQRVSMKYLQTEKRP